MEDARVYWFTGVGTREKSFTRNNDSRPSFVAEPTKNYRITRNGCRFKTVVVEKKNCIADASSSA